MRESVYQNKLIKKLYLMFPGCYIQTNNPLENQGIPDLLILYNDRWAMLEVKLDDASHKQPNQPFYIRKFGEMSFAAFINPQNEAQVLDDLQQSFGVSRQARIS